MEQKRKLNEVINEVINEILLSTDEVTFRDLINVVDKLQEDGFIEETIIDELIDLKRKLIALN